jgi:hypothetical protein
VAYAAQEIAEKFLRWGIVAGGLIRHICKALEDVGILQKSTHVKGGRRLTPSGRRDMDLIAGQGMLMPVGHTIICIGRQLLSAGKTRVLLCTC